MVRLAVSCRNYYIPPAKHIKTTISFCSSTSVHCIWESTYLDRYFGSIQCCSVVHTSAISVSTGIAVSHIDQMLLLTKIDYLAKLWFNGLAVLSRLWRDWVTLCGSYQRFKHIPGYSHGTDDQSYAVSLVYFWYTSIACCSASIHVRCGVQRPAVQYP